MCEFCENIVRDDNEYFEKRVKGGDFIFQEDGEFGILIDTGDSGCLGVLNNIVACPKCGRKIKYLKESEYDPKNNWIDRLNSYCEKYGVCLDEDRPLNVKFFMELVDKMDRFNRGNVDE